MQLVQALALNNIWELHFILCKERELVPEKKNHLVTKSNTPLTQQKKKKKKKEEEKKDREKKRWVMEVYARSRF